MAVGDGNSPSNALRKDFPFHLVRLRSTNMGMNDSSLVIAVVVALSTLLGAAVGGFLSYLGMRRQEFVKDLVGQHRQACEQIKSYYNLEALYCDAVAKQSGGSRDTVLKEFRTQVEKADYERPSWTELEAQKSINRFC
jgi:hypothetical protein